MNAAKKAFIVSQIGDLGLALAIYLIWSTFGTVDYNELMTILQDGTYAASYGGWTVEVIPYLLHAGRIRQGRRCALYVWLPDAMEEPTPFRR